MKEIVCCALFLLGIVWCQGLSPETEKIVREAVKTKCEAVGGEGALAKVEAAKDELIRCVQSNVDPTQVLIALQTYNMASIKETAHKQCLQAPILQGCVRNFTNNIKLCLRENELPNLNAMLEMGDAVVKALCESNGERISTFIEDGGLQCLQDKTQQLQSCFEKSSSDFSSEELTLENLPLLANDGSGCTSYIDLQNCVVDVLKTCDPSSSASTVNVLFDTIKEHTPCNNVNNADSTSVPNAHRRLIRSPHNQQTISFNQQDFFNQNSFNNQPGFPNLNQQGFGAGGGDPMAAVTQALDEAIRSVEPYCLKYGGQKAANELKSTLEESVQYVIASQAESTRRLQESKELPISYLCNDYRKNAHKLISKTAEKAAACVRKEEAHLANFAVEIYDSAADYQCKDDGEPMKKLLKALTTGDGQCLTKLGDVKVPQSCLDRIEALKKDASTDIVLSKARLCGDMKLLKGCFVEVLGAKCSTSGDTYEIMKGFADALYAPCSACSLFIFNSLIVLLLIFVKMF